MPYVKLTDAHMREYKRKGMTQSQVLQARPDIRNPYSLQVAMRRTGIYLVDDRTRKSQQMLTNSEICEIYEKNGGSFHKTVNALHAAGYHKSSARRVIRRMHDEGFLHVPEYADLQSTSDEYVKTDFDILKEKLISSKWQSGALCI